MESDRAAHFERVAIVDLRRLAVRTDLQDLGIAVLRSPRGEPQLVRVIKDHSLIAVAILTDQSSFAGRDLYFVKVMPCLITFIESDVNSVRIRIGHRLDHRANAFC